MASDAWRCRSSRCSPTSTGFARFSTSRPPGSRERRRRPTDLLYPLLDIATTLDPAFNIAYRFGAIFLAEGRDRGLSHPELAIRLLDKGFANNPHKWHYLYDKAFVYYWTYRDARTAAHWFGEAGKVPGSAEWLPGLSAYMLAQGGDRRSSRFLFEQILQTAEHEYMKTTAQWRLGQLDVLDLIDQLNPVLDRYAQRHRQPGPRAGSRWWPPDGCAACQSTPTGCRWSSIRCRGTPRSTPGPPSSRCPTNRHRPSARRQPARRRRQRPTGPAHDRVRVCRRARDPRAVRRLVPQRVHRPAADRAHGVVGAVALSALPAPDPGVGEPPARELAGLRGRCAGCRAAISMQYPAIELVTGAIFATGAWLYRPDAVARVAVDLLERDGRAVHDRPAASDPAQRDHAARHRRRPGVQPGAAPGVARRADRRCGLQPDAVRHGRAGEPRAGQRRAGIRRRQDDRHDGRVSRLADDAGRAVSRVVSRQRHRHRPGRRHARPRLPDPARVVSGDRRTGRRRRRSTAARLVRRQRRCPNRPRR